MTVKELKEKLNKFDDHLIVIIPNRYCYLKDGALPDIPATHVYQGCNEADGCLFIDDYEEQDCETCAYYDTDRSDQPCCSCIDWENWERCEDVVGG